MRTYHPKRPRSSPKSRVRPRRESQVVSLRQVILEVQAVLSEGGTEAAACNLLDGGLAQRFSRQTQPVSTGLRASSRSSHTPCVPVLKTGTPKENR